MSKRYNIYIREHQIIRFRIEVDATHDLRGAIEEARIRYERQGAQLASRAECEIDDAEIFAVDELNPQTGSITRAYDIDGVSASVGKPFDLEN